MAEFAGNLTERVRFERRIESWGSAADRSDGWEPVGERWARVEPLDRASQSALLADTRHSARRWRVTLRAGLTLSLDMRMLWRGLALTLTGIEDDPAQPGRLTLIAEDFGA
ncbi:MAG: head-tail adaptor protein [Sandarakinorhabdus sp.]|nr:head-tail adaptor protein [Sandarakinorhabdus sp.]